MSGGKFGNDKFDVNPEFSQEAGHRCECHACIEEFGLKAGPGEFLSSLPLSAVKMILCPVCGNKRCPKANNHNNVCTGSNEPGQDGSIYQ